AVKSKFIQNFSSRTLYVGIRSSAAEGYAAHRSPNSHRALRPAGGRAEMVRALGAESPTVSRRAFHHHAPEVLRPGDAALSVGCAAHGPRAQLFHRRRAGTLHVDAGPQRPSPHG